MDKGHKETISIRFIVRMPRSYDRGVNYIISRNLAMELEETRLLNEELKKMQEGSDSARVVVANPHRHDED